MTNDRTFSIAHMPALDGLRGVAILLVALSHFCIIFSPSVGSEALIRQITEVGGCGVDLFFVLSGFLITGILLETKGSDSYYTTFYMRRILRIFPLYFAFLTFAFLIAPLLSKRDLMSAVNPWWYIAYAQNWKPNFGASDPLLGHFWSLAVEEQFYLIWPWIVLATDRIKLMKVCGILAVAALACRVVLVFSGANMEAVYRMTPCRVDALVAGAFVACAIRDHGLVGRWLGRNARWILMVSATLNLLILISDGPLRVTALQHTAGTTSFALFFAAIVYFAWSGLRLPAHLFVSSAPLCSIGRYSYGIYVFHMLPNRIVHGSVINFLAGVPEPVSVAAKLLFVVIMFGAVYLMARLSYYLFESRFLALKKHFSYSGGPSRAQVSVAIRNAKAEGTAA